MLNWILPKKFCREYPFVRGSISQLIPFMAVVLKVKPLMDDWVERKRFKEFKRMCKKYGLYVKINAIFTEIYNPFLEKTAIGGESLTTTKAVGFPPDAKVDGVFHVFISHSKHLLEKGFKNGWYPLVIKGRVIQKPYIDLIKFGYDLGYPDCCVNFFQKYNDWRHFSHLYEIFKNTKGTPSFLANPLTRLVSYSYISHLPCSFNCQSTIKYAQKVRILIQKKEPEFIAKVDQILKSPFLVFYENTIYGFEGKLIGNHLYYKNVYFLGKEPDKDLYSKKLKEGDNFSLKQNTIFIFKGNVLKKRINIPKAGERPIVPFLIEFQ